MPKPKADMSQRIKNAGFQKQSAKAMKGGSPQFGIPQQPVNKMEAVKAALEKRRSAKK